MLPRKYREGMSERRLTLLVLVVLVLVACLSCVRAKVILPDTPEAKECAQTCLEELKLCKGSGQGKCKERNDKCLSACPGAWR